MFHKQPCQPVIAYSLLYALWTPTLHKIVKRFVGILHKMGRFLMKIQIYQLGF